MIDFCRAALALFDTLDQAEALAGIQLGQQLHGLVMAAIQIFPYLVQRVVDVDTTGLIVPTVFC